MEKLFKRNEPRKLNFELLDLLVVKKGAIN